MATGPKFAVVTLPAPFAGEVPVTFYRGQVWYSIRFLCDLFGIQGQMQLERIRADDILSRFAEQVPVKTQTGVRETWCISKRGIGWWMATIQRRGVRADLRPSLLALQEYLVEQADRFFWMETHQADVAQLRTALHALEQAHSDHEQFTLALEGRVVALERGTETP